MAITSRAARVTQQASSLYTTPDVVGPGSYIRTERDVPVHGFAPFSSTVERPIPGESSRAGPGPGAYVTPLDNTVGRVPFAPNAVPPGAGAAFSSKVARMPDNAGLTKRQVPGPGQYTLGDEWKRREQQAALVNSAKLQHRAPQAKATGPPSIPAPDQSFGYDETTEGELRMQRPPAGGYTGVSGHRSAGPGEYEPSKATAFTKPAGSYSSFGNSRVPRAVFSENRDVPGPGTYARDDVSERARPSAAFLSRVPLSHQRLLDPEKLVPGPGAYAAMPGITPKAVPENLQAFGSTQKRLASDAITPSERQRMAQPGPGAYEERRTDFKGNAPTGPSAFAQHMAGVAADDPKGRSGFNSSTVRFQPLSVSGKPGPGAYDELDQHSFVANLQKRTHGRNGVFGSTTRRFHTLKKDPVPGAGSYNPVAQGQDDRDEGPSSVFASGVQRFTKSAPTRVSTKVGKQKDAVPPPWQYNVKSANDWGGKAASANPRVLETFGSTTERFPAGELGGGVRIMQVPGPGQYAPKHPDEGFRKQQTTAMCFGTKEARMGAAGRGVYNTKATPGPGQYESNVELSDPLIKRSFNITIG